jgi:choline dehydrogenase
MEPLRVVRAGGEVILSAGSGRLAAVAAALRHRAGGAAAVAGIEPVVDLPGVGENLQDHLQIRAVFAVQGTRPSTRCPTACGARPASGWNTC